MPPREGAKFAGRLHIDGVFWNAGAIVVADEGKIIGSGTLADPEIVWLMKIPTDDPYTAIEAEREAKKFAIRFGWTHVWIRHHFHTKSRAKGPDFESTRVLDRIWVGLHITLYVGKEKGVATRQGDLFCVRTGPTSMRYMFDSERVHDPQGRLFLPLRGIDFFVYPSGGKQIEKIEKELMRRRRQQGELELERLCQSESNSPTSTQLLSTEELTPNHEIDTSDEPALSSQTAAGNDTQIAQSTPPPEQQQEPILVAPPRPSRYVIPARQVRKWSEL